MSTKVTGSAFGDFQAYFEYELSSTNTTYTIKVINAGFKQNCTYATYPWKTTMTATSYDSRSGTDATATTDSGYHSVLEADKSYTYTKKTSSYTVTIKATTKKNIDGGSSGSVSKTFTIPALTKYTITYNANGGSGAPGNTYQYYGIAAALSSTKPTRTGYTFLGWSTSSTATSATWAAGGSYKANASDTLYAVWKAVTCTVTFNANGGVAGSVTSKAKTYGKSITLPTKAESPTRQYYNFLGWSKSSAATSATWAAGATYSEDITSNTTLYAVWEKAYVPAKLTKPLALRVDDESSQDDEGLWGQVSFAWTHGTMEGVNVTPSSIVVYVRETGTSIWYEAYSVANPTETSINTGKFQCNGEALLLESQYDIKVVLTDNYNSANPLTVTTFISKAEFIIDVNAKGTSVSIGEAASDDEDETFNVRWAARLKNHVYLTNGKYIYMNNASGVPRIMMSSNASNQYTFGNGSYTNSEGSVYYDGNAVYIRSKGVIGMTGNVSVTGTTTLSSTLSVSGHIHMPNATYIYNKNAAGTVRDVFGTNSSNRLLIGYGPYYHSEGITSLYGNQISLQSKSEIYFYANNDATSRSLVITGDSSHGYLRPTVDNNTCLGTTTYAWYQVCTERLYVYTARIDCQPTYDNTVSYATNMYVGSSGLFSRTTNTSSRTIKHDIKELSNEDLKAENLYNLDVVQFKYNDGIITEEGDARYGKDLVGFIIEDMDEVYPIAVDKPGDDVKEWSWNAQYLIPPMLKLIQDLRKELDELKGVS